MSVKEWAIKLGELKPLAKSRAGLILLAVRCAMRVEPWMPPKASKSWPEGLAYAVKTAFLEPVPLPLRASLTVKGHQVTLARDLANFGVDAFADAKDEPLGRCMHYAGVTLAPAVEATSMAMGPALKKKVIEAAKMSSGVPAVLAHAGRIKVPKGKDPVEVACVAIWDAIRADISAVAAAVTKIETAKNPVKALGDCAPLWPQGAPGWAKRR
jgi:hypothetical protein